MLEPNRRNAGGLEPGSLATAARVLQRRLEKFGAEDATVQQGPGERLVVEASGVKELGRLEALLLHTGRLEFRMTDMKNQFRSALPEIDKALRRAGVKAPGLPGTRAAGVAQLFGPDTTKQQKKGKAEPDTAELGAPRALSSLLFQGTVPGEYFVPEEQVPAAESLLARPDVQRLMPRGLDLKWSTDVESRGARVYRALYAVEDRPIITGEELEKATATRNPFTKQAIVRFTLSRRGGRTFGRETGRHVNDYMTIILDGRVQGQPPVIRSQIGREGLIELGSKPLAQAQDLAVILTAGSLPVPLVLVEEQVLGPSPSSGGGIDPWLEWAAVAAAVVLWGVMLFALSRRRTTR